MRHLGPQKLQDGRFRFTVWGYSAQTIDLHLLESDTYHPMESDERSYFTCVVDDVSIGDRYLYRINGDTERCDPASRAQPEGVHGASAVVDEQFDWTDADFNPPTRRNAVFYECHVGTFTEAGTFEAIIPHLDYLAELGITCLQLMPIAEFPGARNWGYDGVQLFAAHSAYGGIDGLRKLVNAAHERGLAVYLDVVYNHLGPEGNYLWAYGPYFTDRYSGVWGDNLNFDGQNNSEVRNFFIQNALYWLEVAHIDGFRLDATHAIIDTSPIHFLEDLGDAIHDWGERNNKRVHVIAEHGGSDRRIVLPRERSGYGLDGQWLDDLHHTIHTQLTGESHGYYGAFVDFSAMVKCLREGFVQSGDWTPDRGYQPGSYSGDIPADRFIVCAQNHDQVGNRMKGDRLEHLTNWEGAKLAAGMALLSPYVPLIFMGEEYAESNPFLYFTSHGDPALVEGVRKGRLEEFSYFADQGTPPDPQAESTFADSKLQHDLRTKGKHSSMLNLYKDLLALRKAHPALTNPQRADTNIFVDYQQKVIWMVRRHYYDVVVIGFNWHHTQLAQTTIPQLGATLEQVIDSTDARYSERKVMKPRALDVVNGGNIELAPLTFVVYATA